MWWKETYNSVHYPSDTVIFFCFRPWTRGSYVMKIGPAPLDAIWIAHEGNTQIELLLQAVICADERSSKFV
jgi:hypothetical protein